MTLHLLIGSLGSPLPIVKVGVYGTLTTGCGTVAAIASINGTEQLSLTDITCPQVSFERLVKGSAIATNPVELWHSPASHVLGGWCKIARLPPARRSARSLKRSTL